MSVVTEYHKLYSLFRPHDSVCYLVVVRELRGLFLDLDLVICVKSLLGKVICGDVLFKRKKNISKVFHSILKPSEVNIVNTSVTLNAFIITVKLHH